MAVQVPIRCDYNIVIVHKLETNFFSWCVLRACLQVVELLKLRVLDLGDNKIPTVPLAITGLTNLEELNLANNDISTLPNEMGLMAPKLSSLMLEGNCLKVRCF